MLQQNFLLKCLMHKRVCFAHCIVVCVSHQNIDYSSYFTRWTIWQYDILYDRYSLLKRLILNWLAIFILLVALHHPPLEETGEDCHRLVIVAFFNLLLNPIDNGPSPSAKFLLIWKKTIQKNVFKWNATFHKLQNCCYNSMQHCTGNFNKC